MRGKKNYLQKLFLVNIYSFVINFIGDKLLATDFEISIPFTVPRPLVRIKNKIPLTDFEVFFDAGII